MNLLNPIFGSLVIPCHNQAAALPYLIERYAALTQHRSDVEIIWVDNGSTDDTAEVLQDVLPHYPGMVGLRVDKNLGYGHAVAQGIQVAKGSAVGWTQPHATPQDFLTALEVIEQHGLRHMVKGRYRNRRLPWQMGLLQAIPAVMLGMPGWDVYPTLMPKAVTDGWVNPPINALWDLYAWHQARQAGLTIRRIPVEPLPYDDAAKASYSRSRFMCFLKQLAGYCWQLRLGQADHL